MPNPWQQDCARAGGTWQEPNTCMVPEGGNCGGYRAYLANCQEGLVCDYSNNPPGTIDGPGVCLPSTSSSEQAQCTSAGGTWRMLSDGCGDMCGRETMFCTQATQMGCDCGVNACWAGTICRTGGIL